MIPDHVAMHHRVIASLVILGFAIAGCYDTKHEVFGSAEGVMVQGLDGQYLRDGTASRFTVFWEQHGTDYRLIQQDKVGPQTFGVFRAVPIGANLYVVQVRYDTLRPNIFAQTFFRVIRSGGAIVKLEELIPDEDAAWATSQRDGIEMWSQSKGAKGLSGPHAALNHFLRDLGAVPFKITATYSRAHEDGQ